MAELKNTIVNGILLVNGELIASTIKKRGGTSSGFLKADGSVDTTAYTTNTGTVTSISVGSGLTTSVANSGAITTSGTISLDADLAAIAALTGTSGLLKKTAANTWDLDTNTYLTTTGTAADSSKLGGVAAASYATQDWVTDKKYLTSSSLTGYVTGTSLAADCVMVGDGDSKIKSSGKTIETSLTHNSDDKIPTSKAVYSYVSQNYAGTVTSVSAGNGLRRVGTSTNDITGTGGLRLAGPSNITAATANEFYVTAMIQDGDIQYYHNSIKMTQAGGLLAQTYTVSGTTNNVKLQYNDGYKALEFVFT